MSLALTAVFLPSHQLPLVLTTLFFPSFFQIARSLVALTALLALASCISSSHAAVTAPQIIGYINDLTSQSQALQPKADSLNTQSAVEAAIGRGPLVEINQGLARLVQTITSDIVSPKLLSQEF